MLSSLITMRGYVRVLSFNWLMRIEDWDWFKRIINNHLVNGHLKQVVSHQASILKLPHGPQSNFMTVRFLKSINLQMLYAHYFRTIDCDGVQSLDYIIHVEV